MHVKISKLAAADGTLRGSVKDMAERAADAVFDQGGSPRAQLHAARKASGDKRLAYLPHTGAKQRLKASSRKHGD
jgi:hypothetical protein